jgi:glutamate synthase domain-containing protein 2
MVNDQSKNLMTIRGLFELTTDPFQLTKWALDRNCKKFKTGAMSYGSISQEAHENLVPWTESVEKVILEGGEDLKRFQKN